MYISSGRLIIRGTINTEFWCEELRVDMTGLRWTEIEMRIMYVLRLWRARRCSQSAFCVKQLVLIKKVKRFLQNQVSHSDFGQREEGSNRLLVDFPLLKNVTVHVLYFLPIKRKKSPAIICKNPIDLKLFRVFLLWWSPRTRLIPLVGCRLCLQVLSETRPGICCLAVGFCCHSAWNWGVLCFPVYFII